MQSDRMHPHEHLRPPPIAAVASRDVRLVAEGAEVCANRCRILLDSRVHADRLAITREVPVARDVGKYSDESRAELERLVRQADERVAEDKVAVIQGACLAPSAGGEHAVIRGEVEKPSVGEHQPGNRFPAARDRAAIRFDSAEAAASKARDYVVGGDALDRNRRAVDGRHPGSGCDAPDVIAHAGGRDVTLVSDTAADWLAVTRVMVGAEDTELGVAHLHAPLQLLQASLVNGAEGLDGAHCITPLPLS